LSESDKHGEEGVTIKVLYERCTRDDPDYDCLYEEWKGANGEGTARN
jgi:hypothetical protein